jgi:AbrB family looped-hinge helix DNA binding protein
MTIEFTKLSSKGQIVIPLEIRKNFDLKEGTPFVLITNDDTICLKKMEMPKVKSWADATKPFKEAAKKSNFKKEDLDILIQESKLR